ncbi:gelsolin-like protein 1 isoform X1 [Nematostella vectensis]|uniref:gelsolin-like protein 1 isoform X1 n=2 Tax=Nematostella vectensis TaxID=45351 RepID=UPI002076DE52|nr:gelsolin-like protein 1 isoform X1 [Nematostella vectensis]
MEETINQTPQFQWKNAIAELSTTDFSSNQNASNPIWAFIDGEKKAKESDQTLVKVWQIHDGEMTVVERLGEFISNRAYIVFGTVKHEYSGDPIRNIHIWVSKKTKSRDYVAAMKLAMIDSRLDDNEYAKFHVQFHREIAQHESDLFHSYFTQVKILKEEGGIKKRLFQFHAEKPVSDPNSRKEKYFKKKWMVEQEFLRGSLCSDDVFLVIDPDHFKVYQWNGRLSNEGEKKEAARIANVVAAEWKELQDSQSKSKPSSRITILKLEEIHPPGKDHGMYALFPAMGSKRKEKRTVVDCPLKKLYRLVDGGKLLGSAVEERKVCKSSLTHDNVFLLDTRTQLFVWISQELNTAPIRYKVMLQAEEFLKMEYNQEQSYALPDFLKVDNPQNKASDDFHHPSNKPITLVPENDDVKYLSFDKAFQG